MIFSFCIPEINPGVPNEKGRIGCRARRPREPAIPGLPQPRLGRDLDLASSARGRGRRLGGAFPRCRSRPSADAGPVSPAPFSHCPRNGTVMNRVPRTRPSWAMSCDDLVALGRDHVPLPRPRVPRSGRQRLPPGHPAASSTNPVAVLRPVLEEAEGRRSPDVAPPSSPSLRFTRRASSKVLR